MGSKTAIPVIGAKGFQATVLPAELASDNQKLHVTLEGGREIMVDRSDLTEQPDGTYRLGRNEGEADATVESSQQAQDGEQIVIPLVAEEAHVDKREVITGLVRIKKHVHQQNQVVDQELLREQVDVKRIPINKIVERAPEVYDEGDLMIIPVVEEVLVIEKRLMLKEEIHITRRRETVHEKQNIPLRSEEVIVERREIDDNSFEATHSAPQ